MYEYYTTCYYTTVIYCFRKKHRKHIDVFTYYRIRYLRLQFKASQHSLSALLIVYWYFRNIRQMLKVTIQCCQQAAYFTENNITSPYKAIRY